METFVLIGLWAMTALQAILVFIHLSERAPFYAAESAAVLAVQVGAISLINGWVQ